MYIDTRTSDIPYHEPSKLGFDVNCAGYAIIEECDTGVNRPNGLNDYQIIYVKSGCGHYILNGKETTISAGNALLFRPKEPQIYRYYQADRPQICWMHFSGTEVENILSNLELTDKTVIPVTKDTVIWDLMTAIVDEITLKRNGFMLAAESYAKTTLVNLSRSNNTLPKSKSVEAVERICREMQTEFAHDTENAEYATKCNMSVSHFQLTFRQLTGTSPHNYKMRLRIAAAKNMLINTEYKIVEIATVVGFNDSMYFCKYFKKETGLSPSSFRTQYKP